MADSVSARKNLHGLSRKRAVGRKWIRFRTNFQGLFQESFGVLKHYRPYRYFPFVSFNSCARAATTIFLIGTANIASKAALAQTSPSDTAPISFEEAQRKGLEAVKRNELAEALRWFRKSADQGDARGQLTVGEFYFKGWGLPKNDKEAMVWYRKSADQGNAAAQDKVGRSFHDGSGVRRDYPEAMKWFTKAADQGFAASQTAVCAMYIKGEGVREDGEQGAIWCRKAAEQGHAPAQTLLGLFYLDGKGVPKDDVKAAIWLQKAAEQDDVLAELSLGKLYRQGVGVPKDVGKARFWLQKAAAEGDAEAKKRLAELDNDKNTTVSVQPAKVPEALRFKCTIMAGPEIIDAQKPGPAQDKWKARYHECVRSDWQRLFGTELPSD